MIINRILAAVITLLLTPGISVLIWSGLVTINSYLCRTFGFDEESRLTAAVFLSGLTGCILVALLLIYRGLLVFHMIG